MAVRRLHALRAVAATARSLAAASLSGLDAGLNNNTNSNSNNSNSNNSINIHTNKYVRSNNTNITSSLFVGCALGSGHRCATRENEDED